MTDTHLYTRRPSKVAAIQWTGSNFAEVKRFLTANLGDECGPRNEPDGDYNTVQFFAWDDDQEVDPGRWIVVHLGVDEPPGEILDADEFRAAYEQVLA